MVLLEKIHHGIEVAHVFANHESEVTGMDLLVMHDVVTDLVTSPLSVSGVGKDVLNTGEHGDRHSADVLQWDQISVLLLIVLEDVCVVVSENLETVLAQVLSIVQNGLDGGTVGLVAHVDGKSVVIIQLWVLVHKEFGNQLTERWNVAAEE